VIVPDRVRLPLTFDSEALAAEALALPPATWVPHFNRDIYHGEWAGVALRSIGGGATQLYPDPSPGAAFADTEILHRCPAHRSLLGRLGCPVMAARLLALAPGGLIKEHRDYRLGWLDGEIRLTVPIVTSAKVDFVLDGRPVDLNPGEAWYLDLSRPHRAQNRSGVTRIHLVVDCAVDDWLTDLMQRAIFSGSRQVH
jgi:hypothetical protein